MTKNTVTVIVPCYNVENYLKKCLDSLITQTYKNFEVIMVEDCSTDGTKYIVRRYERQYQNFSAIYNKKNGGLGHARNIGIEMAKTEFIIFLDSDDWLPNNYISEMYKTMVKNKSDVVVCDMYLRYDEGGGQDQRIIAYRGKPNKEGFINNGLAASSSNKLFKRKLFNDLKYPEGMVNEDIPVVLSILSTHKPTYNRNTFYNYYQRTGSIQNSNITSKRFDIFNAVELLRKNLGKNIDQESWEAIVWHQIIAVFLYVLPKARGIHYRKKLLKEFYDLIMKHGIDIENNSGYKEFVNERRINKAYGVLVVTSLNNEHFYVCSFAMSFYRVFNSSKILNNLIFAIRKPRTFIKKADSYLHRRYYTKTVISKRINLDALVKLAQRQERLRNKHPVTVVIPNYNYEKYLIQRVYCILAQTEKIGEILILDDKSTDGSVKLAKEIKGLVNPYVSIRLINNKINRGTFRQWERGFAESKYDLIWIAEADDYSDKNFLRYALKPMDNKNVLISYVNTGYINENGQLIGDVKQDIDYQESGHWDRSYINNGISEVKEYTYLNNTIANVSSVVFKKVRNVDYKKYFADARQYRQAGDWVFYVSFMLHGDVAYTDKVLNYYRIHGNNVSSTTKAQDHVNEILRIQKQFIKQLKLNSKHQKAMDKRIKMLRKAWNL